MKKIQYRIHNFYKPDGDKATGYALDLGEGAPMICVRQICRGYWRCDDYLTGAALTSRVGGGRTRAIAAIKAAEIVMELWRSGEYQRAMARFQS